MNEGAAREIRKPAAALQTTMSTFDRIAFGSVISVLCCMLCAMVHWLEVQCRGVIVLYLLNILALVQPKINNVSVESIILHKVAVCQSVLGATLPFEPPTTYSPLTSFRCKQMITAKPFLFHPQECPTSLLLEQQCWNNIVGNVAGR